MIKKIKTDCIRVQKDSPNLVVKKITPEQLKNLETMFDKAGKDKIKMCELYKISSLKDFPLVKYEKTIKRLKEITNEN